MTRKIRAVLFDLDGTLLDTAPDMIDAANTIRAELSLPPLADKLLRPSVSHGAAAILTTALAKQTVSPAQFEQFREQFLAIYAANIAQRTRLFPGMEQLLDDLEANNIVWGVVTNKPSFLTIPLLSALNLLERCCAAVSGDTTAENKPHPLPMFYACEKCKVTAEQTLYIGDAERDIVAGKAAGMTTLAALYGYLGADDKPELWGADGMIEHPLEIKRWIAAFN